MQRHDNPFHDLWLTEILTPEEFVRMFSPQVALNASQLFATGNVVVRGTQGSGKSMLLNLLNTRTRIAYERARVDYPGVDAARPFISAGVHLIRAGASKVASRLAEQPEIRRRMWAATTFGDYINYCLVEDLLENLLYLASEQAANGALRSQIALDWNANTQADFVHRVASSEVWFGYLQHCTSLADVRAAVSARLTGYRGYFNFNHELDASIERSKTAIAQPLLVIADALRSARVVPNNALFFLRIDQHEELFALEQTTGTGSIFRQVINSALSARDGRVSFRIGTRHYSWNDNVEIWGSGAKLENMRDYVVIDLDETFRRRENARSGRAFDAFAEDVFRRRLLSTDFGTELTEDQKESPLLWVFGKTLTAAERACHIGLPTKPLVSIPPDWDPRWKSELEALWTSGERLHAKLGEAWLRQTAQQRAGIHRDRSLVEGHPWRGQKYWIKERNEAALVQLAGSAIQSLVWSGQRNVIDLSGFNILAFMSICRSIWAAWLRYVQPEDLAKLLGPPQIPESEQSIGIAEASKIWFDKLREGFDGDKRTTFVSALGTWFAKEIREDRSLSNPGHNGFSIMNREFARDCEMVRLVKSSRDQGDLIEVEHTTKSADQVPRTKWYLHPLLCPTFRIPFVRTKEPIYTNLAELEAVFRREQLGYQAGARRKSIGSPDQATLFGD